MGTRKTPHQKPKSSSVAQQSALLQSALVDELPSPPAYITLTDKERIVWDVVMRARARSDYHEVDAPLIAELCTLTVRLDRMRLAMDNEPAVIEDENGKEKANPFYVVMNSLSGRVMRIHRQLQLSGHKRSGPAGEGGKRKAAEKAADEASEEMRDEDLLAVPNVELLRRRA
jgi:hypothetical protein